MTRKSRNDDALATMRAANPFSATKLREAIAEAELSRAMQRAIAVGESPARPIPAGDRVARERSRRHPLRPAWGFLATSRRLARPRRLACVAVIAALILLSGGSVDSVRDGGRPTFAAAAVKVAEANPRLLVTAPGWSIVHARSFEVDTGALTYKNDGHPLYGPEGGRQLNLTWYPARFYRDRLREDGHACCHVSRPMTSTLLGQRATTFAYAGQHPNFATILSPQGNVFIELSGSFGSKAGIRGPAALAAVGRRRCLAQLRCHPKSSVPQARSAAIAQMLRGIPAPPGFDASALHFRVMPGPVGLLRLQSESALTDRFMLGKSVTGAVACGWLQRWLSATRAGDGAAAQEAVEAMGTARHWPVLLQMVREKGYQGNALPPHGQGWPSEILTAARRNRPRPPQAQAGSQDDLREGAPRRVPHPGRGGPGERHGLPLARDCRNGRTGACQPGGPRGNSRNSRSPLARTPRSGACRGGGTRRRGTLRGGPAVPGLVSRGSAAGRRMRPGSAAIPAIEIASGPTSANSM